MLMKKNKEWGCTLMKPMQKSIQEATLEKNTLKIIMAELKWQKYGWFYFANFL